MVIASIRELTPKTRQGLSFGVDLDGSDWLQRLFLFHEFHKFPGLESTTEREAYKCCNFSKDPFIAVDELDFPGYHLPWYWTLWKLTLSQMTNFRCFQTDRVCSWQFQIYGEWQKDLQTDRKPCRKRRNCLSRAIFPLPAVFSKDLYIKTRACLR